MILCSGWLVVVVLVWGKNEDEDDDFEQFTLPDQTSGNGESVFRGKVEMCADDNGVDATRNCDVHRMRWASR